MVILLTETQVRIITESYEPILSPADVFGYIRDKHSRGWDKNQFDDWEWVNKFDYYKLEEIPVGSLNIKAKKPKVAVSYSKRDYKEYPPIVIDSETRDIIDGNHRTLATKLCGEPTIKAYVGYHQ
jgi:hypothetical protein